MEQTSCLSRFLPSGVIIPLKILAIAGRLAMSVTPYLPGNSKRTRSQQPITISTKTQRTPNRERVTRHSNPARFDDRKVENLKMRSPRLPGWLRALLFLQQSSATIAFFLIAATLGVYAWTVYAPKQWSQEYKKLETLHRHERHLTATNETLKNQLAQQAERPETGLANPQPQNAIFLAPTAKSRLITPKNLTAAQEKPLVTTTPLAY